jgi:hypothetical protein
MGLKDKIVKAFALRYAKAKIKDLRGKDKDSQMGKALKYLEGYKLILAVIGLAVARAWDMQHNGHAGDTLGIVLSLLGWTPGADWSILARDIGTHVLAIAAIAHKLYTANQQMKAGATLGQTLSSEGYVVKAIADATEIPVRTPDQDAGHV